MKIRPASLADLGGLVRVFTEENLFHAALVSEFIRATENILSPDELKEMIDHPEQKLLVAEDEGEIIGAALASVDASDPEPWIQPRRFGYLQDIVVRTEFRGRGVGKLLLDGINTWAKEQGLAELELHVWHKNHRALVFYRSLGYETTRYTMRKRLIGEVGL